ncbi:MAG: LamG-like jellyroll fold domain-containing protein [Planctomycetota bacterium]
MKVDDEFIDRVLEGAVTADEIDGFQDWLAEPANLRHFAIRAELHADLRRSLRRRRLQADAMEANREPSATLDASGSHHTQVFVSRPIRLLTATVFVTAACILIAFALPNPDPELSRDNAVAATVVSNVNGLLAKDGRQWVGEELPAGSYELQKGLVNLEFSGGVMVYVEAPATFEAVDDSRVVLQRGRLSARVPHEGIGFTVETPEAEVVDFGTEFSVDVVAGISEVHVFDGLVRVHTGSTNHRDEELSVDVQASKAVRITGAATKPVDISIASDRFIRDFDEPVRNYALTVKRLSPRAYYRMPIRDRGLVSEPPEHSGVVLTGEGKRPPHARGVFVGGSLRVGADSTGRGARVDSPPAFTSSRFSLSAFVYLETPSGDAVVATNLTNNGGNFRLSLDESGKFRATAKNKDGERKSIAGNSILPFNTWRHVVFTVDGEQMRLYEDGELVASSGGLPMATTSDSDPIWFGAGSASEQHWNGRIDEVALFDRVLTGDEVVSLYRAAQKEIARLP